MTTEREMLTYIIKQRNCLSISCSGAGHNWVEQRNIPCPGYVKDTNTCDISHKDVDELVSTAIARYIKLYSKSELMELLL